MLKVNVGLSRKLSRDYNSTGFSLNLEGEICVSLDDPETLVEKVKEFYDLAEEALNQQIVRYEGESAIASRDEEKPVRPATKATGTSKTAPVNRMTAPAENGAGQFCSPCLRMENENSNLVGGAEASIQVVENWLANDLEQWGITPGMQLGTPYLFILDREGKVHGLTPQGLGCVLRGYQSPEAVTRYLTLPEHGVSLEQITPAVVQATVEGAEASPETFAAVLSAHLVEASGQQEGDEPFLYGGLFDFSLDVPESWKSIGVKILTAQKLDFPAAGISIDWSGPERSFRLARDSLTISPGVKASVRKWGISYSASLDGLSFEPDLSSVTFLLTGAPDLTVVLK